MSLRELILIVAVSLLGLANIYVSYRVCRSASYDWRQKTAQLAMTWLIPLVGLYLVRTFLDDDGQRNFDRPVDGLGDMGALDVYTSADLAGGHIDVAQHDA